VTQSITQGQRCYIRTWPHLGGHCLPKWSTSRTTCSTKSIASSDISVRSGDQAEGPGIPGTVGSQVGCLGRGDLQAVEALDNILVRRSQRCRSPKKSCPPLDYKRFRLPIETSRQPGRGLLDRPVDIAEPLGYVCPATGRPDGRRDTCTVTYWLFAIWSVRAKWA